MTSRNIGLGRKMTSEITELNDFARSSQSATKIGGSKRHRQFILSPVWQFWKRQIVMSVPEEECRNHFGSTFMNLSYLLFRKLLPYIAFVSIGFDSNRCLMDQFQLSKELSSDTYALR